MDNFFRSKTGKRIGWGLLAVILIVILNPISCVSASDRGVKVRFGAVQDGTLSPGLQFRLPLIEQIHTYTIQPQTLNFKIDVGQNGAITHDNQTVGVSMAVFYRYSSDRIVEIARSYSSDKIETILKSTAESAIKTEIGHYTIFDLAASQADLTGKVLSNIKVSVVQYPIEIVDLKLTNYDWSDHFDQQIQETMNKAQQVKQKEQELQITQLETQKKVKAAEAEKEAAILLAEGEKQSAIVKAEGERERVRLESEAKVLQGEAVKKYNLAIQPNLEIELKLRTLAIEQARVDKWDGHYVPNNRYGPIPVDTTGGIQGK